MSEYQKPLDPETIARMGREWDKGIRERRSFSIRATIVPTPEGGEDVIFLAKDNGGRVPTPDGMQVIEASQMGDDLKSTHQKALDPETIARMGREWDKGINEKRAFSIHAKVSPTPEGGEADTIFVVDNNVNTRRPIPSTLKVIKASQMDDDLKPRKTSE